MKEECIKMIVIDKNRCCACGRCQFVRMALACIKENDDVIAFEDPKESDRQYVEKAVIECPACAIFIKE